MSFPVSIGTNGGAGMRGGGLGCSPGRRCSAGVLKKGTDLCRTDVLYLLVLAGHWWDDYSRTYDAMVTMREEEDKCHAIQE